jgi:hypothetical protein
MSEWQPIETAPKDGTPHLRGLWVKRISQGEFWDMWDMDVGHIDDCGDFLNLYGEELGWEADDYTHWMPLPEPPK